MNAVRIALNIGSLVLVAVLGWLLVRIGLGVFQPESLYEPAPIIAPTSSASTGTRLAAYDFSSDPFAFGEIAVDLSEFLEDDNAPETTLNLKLIGIVSDSSATFQMSDGKNKPVKIDEEVMNGVMLKRTAKDFVSLDVNGEPQRLTLERVKLGEKAEAQIITRAAPKSVSNQQARTSIEDLFKNAQVTPSKLGLKITAQPGGNLEQFKLKSGDILTRIGPVATNTGSLNPQDLLKQFSSGTVQDFEVIRNGTPVTIRIGQ